VITREKIQKMKKVILTHKCELMPPEKIA
jgi:hypothetical protein